MKINEVIREKRKEQGMTQEQVAVCLGVTAPAVNKWEKGTTYPDITLLPALARLLKTDLNTLLSFREELTEQEIGQIVTDICKIIDEDGYPAGFCAAMEKIREFPNCELLLYNLTFTLGGTLVFDSWPGDKHIYEEKLEKLYEHLTASSDDKIRSAAASMMFSRCMQREEYNRAEDWIECLPQHSPIRQMLLARLYIQQENYVQALPIIEHRLMASVSDARNALLIMLEIAVQEGRTEDAELYAKRHEMLVQAFDLIPYSAAIAKLELAAAGQDIEKSISILKEMLPAMTKKWDLTSSPFYKHIRQEADAGSLQHKILPSMLKSIRTDDIFSFLRDNAEVNELLKRMEETGS